MKYHLIGLIVAAAIPLMTHAQDTTAVSFDEYVEQLNAKCPIDDEGRWSIRSITMVGDRYALVDFQMPENMSMVLPALSKDSENVKRLWIKQLKQFGQPWNHFVDLMVEAERRIIVILNPEGTRKPPMLTLNPADFKK